MFLTFNHFDVRSFALANFMCPKTLTANNTMSNEVINSGKPNDRSQLFLRVVGGG